MTALYELAGGREGVRAVLDDFYRRVFDDVMIGFFFRSASRERLVEKETELTLAALGAEVAYTGRAMDDAHAAHHIMGGHFMRRLQILRETLRDHEIPPEVCAAWIEHTEKLRPLITRDEGSDCSPPDAAGEA